MRIRCVPRLCSSVFFFFSFFVSFFLLLTIIKVLVRYDESL